MVALPCGIVRLKSLLFLLQRCPWEKIPKSTKISKPLHKIKACIVFVALRGGVNTGRFEKKIDFADRDTFSTFEGHLQTVLEWKKDPAKFIKELVEQSDQDELHKIIKEKLKKSK